MKRANRLQGPAICLVTSQNPLRYVMLLTSTFVTTLNIRTSKCNLATQVVVRCRPLNSKEKTDGRDRIVDMDTDAGQVKVRLH